MRRLLRNAVAALLLGGALGAGGLAALADPPKGGFAPDPPSRASQKQWIFDVTMKGNQVRAERAKPATFDKAAETPRVLGRFALELWVGRELLDRVRFNVPLMGGEPTIGNRNRLPKPRFEENLTAHVSARMADNPRAAYLLLVDRETGDFQKMEWPPEADGHLVSWTMGLSDAGPGDFPDGGVRAIGLRDGGAGDAGKAGADGGS
jgi:hypothetical protein